MRKLRRELRDGMTRKGLSLAPGSHQRIQKELKVRAHYKAAFESCLRFGLFILWFYGLRTYNRTQRDTTGHFGTLWDTLLSFSYVFKL